MKKYFFLKIISKLEHNNIIYSLVGNTYDYPEIITSDVDIIILQSQLGNAFNCLWDIDLKVVQILQHEAKAFYFILASEIDNTFVFIHPDICSDYYVKGRLLLKSDDLLHNLQIAKYPSGISKGFKILSPENEFLYYLVKKICKSDISEKHFEHLLGVWKTSKEGCCKNIEHYFSKENAMVIINSFTNRNSFLLKNELQNLQKDLYSKKKQHLTDWIANVLLKIRRIVYPTGIWIVFMGPDGSGKTTIIAEVSKNILPAFRRKEHYHLFPKPIKERRTVNNPHEAQPRSLIGSILKLVFFLLIYNIGFLKWIYPSLIRSTLVIFDRYYHDIIVDPRRYRYSGSSIWSRIIGKFIPKPDMWFLLDAPAEILQSRKPEVTFQESERQVKEYKKLFSSLNNAFIINANRPIKEISFEIEQKILLNMEKRTRKRYYGKL